VHRYRYESQPHVMRTIGDWIGYQPAPHHQALGMKAPDEAFK
jgi:hypothetical protein